MNEKKLKRLVTKVKIFKFFSNECYLRKDEFMDRKTAELIAEKTNSKLWYLYYKGHDSYSGIYLRN